MNFNALRYEELTLNAFPVLHTEVYDGWILRFSGGEGYQGNCISPLYLSTRAYEDKIDYCENKFREKGLPCVFKMTPNVPAALDQQLAMRQYELEDKTYIMECSLTSEDSLSSEEAQALPSGSPTGEDDAQENNIPVKTEIRLSREIDDNWLEAFLTLEGMDKDICPETARTMLNAIRKPVYCAALYENEISHGSKADCGRIVGCGLGVVEDNKIGIYDIRVESRAIIIPCSAPVPERNRTSTADRAVNLKTGSNITVMIKAITTGRKIREIRYPFLPRVVINK